MRGIINLFKELLARTTVNTGYVATPTYHKKAPPTGMLFCGGQRWIRTTEVEDVRFTV